MNKYIQKFHDETERTVKQLHEKCMKPKKRKTPSGPDRHKCTQPYEKYKQYADECTKTKGDTQIKLERNGLEKNENYW